MIGGEGFPLSPREVWEALLTARLHQLAAHRHVAPPPFVLSKATLDRLEAMVWDATVFHDLDVAWLAALDQGDDAWLPVRL